MKNVGFAHNRWRLKRVGIVALVSFAPILLGLPLAIWASRNALEVSSSGQNQEIIMRIDAILDSTEQAMSSAAELLGGECNQVVSELRRRSAAATFVFAMQLLDGMNVYCSTVSGSAVPAQPERSFVDGELGLFISRIVAPGKSMVGVRVASGQRSVVSYIDVLHVSQLLGLGESSDESVLSIGSVWLDSRGEIHEGEFTSLPIGFVTTNSGRYPYSIKTGFATDAAWAYLWSRFWPLLALIVCLGVVGGYGAYRFLTQARSFRAELQRGLRNGELVAYYQPLTSGDAKSWAGVEVLVRWQHPLEGMIPPDVFIPFMERTELIVPMTTYLLGCVADELAPVADKLPKPFHVGINISAAHLVDSRFYDYCRRFLVRLSPSGVSLFLELTEREEIVATDEILERLRQFREIGVHLALDDFGVGYCNLKYLMEFQMDVLKIDRAFVSGVPTNKSARHILDSIVDLADRLKLDTVAEGIETQSEVDYLKTKGINLLQGYFFAQPVQIQDLLVALADPPPSVEKSSRI
ncbi:MAG: EAL domain-containing protein [Xanthomonadaceae bacterium]|jgi:sensor c-di-GMP phosphodiesterase-like protein|nr:EAL domain-containing protein [Xanthomonadaceae bacterium]